MKIRLRRKPDPEFGTDELRAMVLTLKEYVTHFEVMMSRGEKYSESILRRISWHKETIAKLEDVLSSRR